MITSYIIVEYVLTANIYYTFVLYMDTGQVPRYLCTKIKIREKVSMKIAKCFRVICWKVV